LLRVSLIGANQSAPVAGQNQFKGTVNCQRMGEAGSMIQRRSLSHPLTQMVLTSFRSETDLGTHNR
jgi:hypothetical protein